MPSSRRCPSNKSSEKLKKGAKLLKKLRSLLSETKFQDAERKELALYYCQDIERKLRKKKTHGSQESLVFPDDSNPAHLDLEKLDLAEEQIIAKHITIDGYEWIKCLSKTFKDEVYPRDYYKCTHDECPGRIKVHRDHHGNVTKILGKVDHNCKNLALANGSNTCPPVLMHEGRSLEHNVVKSQPEQEGTSAEQNVDETQVVQLEPNGGQFVNENQQVQEGMLCSELSDGLLSHLQLLSAQPMELERIRLEPDAEIARGTNRIIWELEQQYGTGHIFPHGSVGSSDMYSGQWTDSSPLAISAARP